MYSLTLSENPAGSIPIAGRAHLALFKLVVSQLLFRGY